MRTMDWLYIKSVEGFPGFKSTYELAENYSTSDPWNDAGNLIKWQDAKASTSGFLAGMGGIISFPLIPVNIIDVMHIQIRMVSAIAIIGGHNPMDDKVKSLVYVCIVGNGIKEVVKTRIIKLAMNRIPFKAIPFIGGIIGGTFDGLTTHAIGTTAREIFVASHIELPTMMNNHHVDRIPLTKV